MYVNYDIIKNQYAGKEIYIFGAGIIGVQASNLIKDIVIIRGFIDNYKAGAVLNGYNIISLGEYMQRGGKELILISALGFLDKISNQLIEEGLQPEKDWIVWDNDAVFCHDENSAKFVDFLKNVWESYRIDNSDSKILITFRNEYHELDIAKCAYLSNYLARKYNASIVAYNNFGETTVPRVQKDIYEAFNVQEIIEEKLTSEQEQEADDIVQELWNKLYTWEDWDKIKIYGIHFGTSIVSTYIRLYLPDFDLRSNNMRNFLISSVKTIVFWYHYINDNDVKAVLMLDGVTWDGYIRDIAITKGINAYAIFGKMEKLELDYIDGGGERYQYFDKMWEEDLTEDEKKFGLKWAEEHLNKRLSGDVSEVGYMEKKCYPISAPITENRILEDNGKTKVLICPHIFEESSRHCGEQIFDNCYLAWLTHLGELSEKTPNLDWYLKLHPAAMRRDIMIADEITKRYPLIKKLPAYISPIQLRNEGVKYALTVQGTLGHEYPGLGIQVINAGANPHSCFDFCWNPKTKEEYDDLIMNLDNLPTKKDEIGLYKFYSLRYYFYEWKNYIPWRKIFFTNELFGMSREELNKNGRELGTWLYGAYMDEWTTEFHEMVMKEVPKIFYMMDIWRPDKLYRKDFYYTQSIPDELKSEYCWK